MLIFSSHSTELYLNVDLQLLTIFIASSKYSSSDIEQKKYLFPLICRYEMQFSVSAKYIFKFPLEYFWRGGSASVSIMLYFSYRFFLDIQREGKLKVCIHEQACHVPVVLLYKHCSQKGCALLPNKINEHRNWCWYQILRADVDVEACTRIINGILNYWRKTYTVIYLFL